MWELHTQRAGGIIGDEMGLGKTIQVRVYSKGRQGDHRTGDGPELDHPGEGTT